MVLGSNPSGGASEVIMWMLEMLLLSLVGGTLLGIGWRIFDEWREKNSKE